MFIVSIWNWWFWSQLFFNVSEWTMVIVAVSNMSAHICFVEWMFSNVKGWVIIWKTYQFLVILFEFFPIIILIVILIITWILLFMLPMSKCALISKFTNSISFEPFTQMGLIIGYKLITVWFILSFCLLHPWININLLCLIILLRFHFWLLLLWLFLNFNLWNLFELFCQRSNMLILSCTIAQLFKVLLFYRCRWFEFHNV